MVSGKVDTPHLIISVVREGLFDTPHIIVATPPPQRHVRRHSLAQTINPNLYMFDTYLRHFPVAIEVGVI